MTESELKKYYAIITDAWQLFKKNSSPRGDDEFWTNLLQETDALHTQHGQTIFSERILNTVLNEIEQIYKHGDNRQSKAITGNQESIFGGVK